MSQFEEDGDELATIFLVDKLQASMRRQARASIDRQEANRKREYNRPVRRFGRWLIYHGKRLAGEYA